MKPTIMLSLENFKMERLIEDARKKLFREKRVSIGKMLPEDFIKLLVKVLVIIVNAESQLYRMEVNSSIEGIAWYMQKLRMH